MINPNGEDFTQNDPSAGATKPGEQTISSTGATPGGAMGDAATPSRFEGARDKVTSVASDAWRQTKETAGTGLQRTSFYVRENPVPTVIGALALGLAIGLAIRYSSNAAEREPEVKTPFGDLNLGMLSMPFLWPFFKSVQRRYEDSAEVVRDGVKTGVDRLKDVDVNQYVKPLRKQWRSWTR
jgi:hypothetical protein